MTHVRLVGAGADGLGEDVSVFREHGTALHETWLSLPLEAVAQSRSGERGQTSRISALSNLPKRTSPSVESA